MQGLAVITSLTPIKAMTIYKTPLAQIYLIVTHGQISLLTFQSI